MPLGSRRRAIWAWAMYDWANSAYVTTTAAALLPAYFVQVVVPPEGVRALGLIWSGEALWGLATGAASLVAFLLAPFLGAVADLSGRKKAFLMGFAYAGSLFASLLFFAQAGRVGLTLGLYALAQICFISANVFYDAFLPHLTRHHHDRVSARGYAMGYLGGGLQFACALVLVSQPTWFGLQTEEAVRLALLMAGLWWAVFSLWPLLELPESNALGTAPEPSWGAYVKAGWRQVRDTLRRLPRAPSLLLFLVAFMFYDDAIQSTIAMASAYGAGELKLEPSAIMGTFLVVQFVAYGGSRLFGLLGERWNTKPALLLSLAVWVLIILGAYLLPSGYAPGFLGLGLMVGLVLGGSQALSRSLYSQIIPPQASAQFFGFYTVFSRFSAIWGPLWFALVRTATGSSRAAILSLLVFLVIGMVFLAILSPSQARAEARQWTNAP
ncbi:MAG: MFS transporter [Bacteroidetes bacterium]|nr:MFS transporter [Rhodothermia bacterium]MCS7155589.1 MFS transporter [Bacteroidota bacterium]MCX7906447.1 MFS transporter [Bacteroidota bacterium]MDW8137271.1 MFS transporter [Bacteroidota bacterium]MDW8284859.1 MFS transporter [Bacteroidota bacterium]